MKAIIVVTVGALGLLTRGGLAGWAEQGDAGDILVGGVQSTVGVGPLTAITGSTAANGDFIDAYRITITDVPNFFATTSTNVADFAERNFDTRLWLFDNNGVILLGNDDHPNDLGSTISDRTTFNALTGGDVDATANGIDLANNTMYILAIGGFANDPLNAANAPIINLDNLFTELHGPNVGAGALASWKNTVGSADGRYKIALQGATYYLAPGPGALALLALAGVARTRRRA